ISPRGTTDLRIVKPRAASDDRRQRRWHAESLFCSREKCKCDGARIECLLLWHTCTRRVTSARERTTPRRFLFIHGIKTESRTRVTKRCRATKDHRSLCEHLWTRRSSLQPHHSENDTATPRRRTAGAHER